MYQKYRYCYYFFIFAASNITEVYNITDIYNTTKIYNSTEMYEFENATTVDYNDTLQYDQNGTTQSWENITSLGMRQL